MTLLTPSIVATGPVPPAIEIREAVPADTDAVARIMYEAFRRFHESRGFTPDVPDLETTTGIAAGQIEDPASYGVVALSAGRIVGSNFLSEGDAIRGVGPISVDPDIQDAGVGRLLMQAVLKRGAKARGVRLLQDAFNTKSMALYASLGFRVREPVVVMTGRPRDRLPAGTQVRPMAPADLIAADNLARRVHGYARGAELRAALGRGTPVVLVHDGRVVAYMTMPNMWLLNHAVAESQADLMALVLGAGAASPEPIGFLAPIRHAEFFRWCLGQGLQIVKPMTLMTRGEYSEPRGAWIPSVLY
ncbi:GNAT family N-acetyltransferase [Defluviimonas sp. WL0024]|uniref:GNAT family N-acetyltransferase n=2 Tax=Albidovulum TaxID=205889 RepID=A0ABT3J467_9RHOB|nr:MULTISPECIES: GNAT family N-acetyltransferase [Defluviimonas]MCU9850524.1 GNAT family N-acetyltransferase [Defluviimonas sp. WL0024]MCW3782461.1 GNAT family N-acetyltransferase [Defluviimonas salinarum]